MINKFSDLVIIFSNCLNGGSSWVDIQSQIIELLRQAFYDTSGVEFRACNANNVSGDHSSTTLTVNGVFYHLKNNINKTEMIELEDIVFKIANQIEEFSCAEVRIEHTRHRSTFPRLTHPQLARLV